MGSLPINKRKPEPEADVDSADYPQEYYKIFPRNQSSLDDACEQLKRYGLI